MRIIFLSFALVYSHVLFAMNIIIDPGHGGSDKGATQGANCESKLTLQIANHLLRKLKADSQFKATLTRSTDVFLSLEDRATFANTNGDLFLSIHINSSTNSDAHGSEIYFQNQLQPDEESLFLASRENKNLKIERQVFHPISKTIVNKPKLAVDVQGIIEDLERNSRLKLSGWLAEQIYTNWAGIKNVRHQPIRQAPFFVVSNLDLPAVLIEVGYLTNPTEAKLLLTSEYQEKVADGIYKAVLRYKEFVDKSVDKSLN